jgi:hypothetical protein
MRLSYTLISFFLTREGAQLFCYSFTHVYPLGAKGHTWFIRELSKNDAVYFPLYLTYRYYMYLH